MCGLAGFALPLDSWIRDPREAVTRMTDCLVHRGPDASGVWVDEKAGIALGHRRLSILDLTDAGLQPMSSPSGRYIISFNGEFYNHAELRTDLQEANSANWRGHSDTETFLAAIDFWGVHKALARSVGMFAFALWDRQTSTLTLARDRMGEKPLYYGFCRRGVLFGSQLSALKSFPEFAPSIDPEAIALFVSRGEVPAPRSIYAQVCKVRPGELVTFSLANGRVGPPRAELYWSIHPSVTGPRFAGSAEDAVQELGKLLTQSIGQQMLADVPVGAFLSGGVDSSAVVAFMQQASSQPVRTFSIGFEDEAYNEAHHAAAVAKHLNTAHTELIVTPRDALDMVPRLAQIWDEPFADPSQIPTAIVSTLARQQVTVSLSGDGGDELFCGYNRYFAARQVERLPGKPLIGAVLRAIPTALRETVARATSAITRLNAHRLQVVMDTLRYRHPADRYVELFYQPGENRRFLKDRDLGRVPLISWKPPANLDFLATACAVDAENYLPDEILTKVDRAAMSVSLETRVPLLDHRIVEFAFRLPTAYKVRNGQSKWPLRQLLYQYVPRKLIDRPKMGFGIPVGSWLRGALKKWAGDLLSADAIRRDGLLNEAYVSRLWREHQSGEADHDERLWRIVSLRNWQTSR